MRRSLRPVMLAAALLACALVACSHAPVVAWLTVERVEPSVLEPGVMLHVVGSGFPAGAACRLELAGRTSRPGLASMRAAIELPCRAASNEEVTAQVDGDALGALGVHGSFAGELRVSFAAAAGGEVTGSHAVALDLSQPLGRGMAHAQRLRERASALLAYAGIEAAHDAELAGGLRIAAVKPDGRADALGLRAGDTLVRAAGVAVHGLGDLAPPPHAREISLRVRRDGEVEQQRMLSIAGLERPDPGPQLDRMSVLLAWLLVCGLLLSPLPTPVRWLQRAVGRVRQAPSAQLGLWGGTRRATHERGMFAAVMRALLPASVSVFGVLAVYFEPAGFLAVRSISVYLGLCAASAMLSLGAEGQLRDRVRAALVVGGRMTVMGLLVACACALSGTRALDGIVEAQGPQPWAWGVACKPALLIAFPLYVVYASRLGGTTLAVKMRGRAVQLLVAERVLTNVVLCALGAAIFLGGWQTPGTWLSAQLDPHFIGAVLFVLKAWLIAWLLSGARSVELGAGLRTPYVVIWCAIVVGLTALFVWLEPSVLIELALGRAVCAAFACIALAAGAALSERAWTRTPQPKSA